MIVLALTGSIGMGKSTTAAMFADAGVPVWDADAVVHKLYSPDGAGVDALRAIAPEAIGPKGVDRALLRNSILKNAGLLNQIEAVIHPLVAKDRARFLSDMHGAGHDLVLVDIPLLYEGGGEANVDQIVVVTAPAEVQRERVLARPGMTPEAFEAILAKQVPDDEKRTKADYVIDTSLGMEHARTRVHELIEEVRLA